MDDGDGSLTAACASPGDTNLDRSITILDAAEFFTTGLYDAGAYVAPAGVVVAVPEPACLPLVAAAWGVRRWDRRGRGRGGTESRGGRRG